MILEADDGQLDLKNKTPSKVFTKRKVSLTRVNSKTSMQDPSTPKAALYDVIDSLYAVSAINLNKNSHSFYFIHNAQQLKWTEINYFRSIIKDTTSESTTSYHSVKLHLIKKFHKYAAQSIDKDCIFVFDYQDDHPSGGQDDHASDDQDDHASDSRLSKDDEKQLLEQQAYIMFFVCPSYF